MEYKVIPFTAHVDHKTGSPHHVSMQLEKIINQQAEEGWTYLQLETVTNTVPTDAGCFGFGAKPGFTVLSNMLVFKKWSGTFYYSPLNVIGLLFHNTNGESVSLSCPAQTISIFKQRKKV